MYKFTTTLLWCIAFAAVITTFFIPWTNVFATNAPMWWGINFIDVDFSNPASLDDGFTLDGRNIIVSDGLEVTSTIGPALVFNDTTVGDYVELLWPYTKDAAQKWWFAHFKANNVNLDEMTLRIHVLDENGNTLVWNHHIGWDDQTVDLTSINDNDIYFAFDYRIRENLTWNPPKVFTFKIWIGDSSEYPGYEVFHENLTYANDHPRQKLDIYRAPDTSSEAPWVLFVHGGGNTKWDKSTSLLNRELYYELLDAWISVVAMNYRLYKNEDGGTQFPETYKDTFHALDFMKDNASTYGLDPNNVVLWGESAWGRRVIWVSSWDDDPTYDKLVSTDWDIPTIKWVMAQNTPTMFDRDSFEDITSCDGQIQTWFLRYYGLAIIIIERGIFDWTEYYTRPSVAIDIAKAKIETHLGSEDASIPYYFGYSTPLYNGDLPEGADCIHSANYGAYIEPFFIAAGVPFEMYREDGGDVPGNPSTIANELSFISDALYN